MSTVAPRAARSGPVTLERAIAKLLIFWDYDTQWGADRSRSPGVKRWGQAEFENTERLLEMHARYEIPGCFAVVGAAALPGARPYHDPAQIRAIHAAGHEIGSHSFRHEWLPGLSREALQETLRRSRETLEDCIGAAVVSFVPPFNQPFDNPRRLAFSISERRQARTSRIGLHRLCTTLRECGYRFCRVVYRPVPVRVAEALSRRRLDRPVRLERIAGLSCLRLNVPVGFGSRAIDTIEPHLARGGMWVLHAHPHSASDRGSAQSFGALEQLFERAVSWQASGRAMFVLPRDLV